MSVLIDDYVEAVNSLEKSLDKINATDEVKYRLYCNRAYYAVYHKAIEVLDTKHNYKQVSQQAPYTNYRSHERLTEFMADINNQALIGLIFRLKLLKSFRVKADYALDKTISQTDFNRAVRQFKSIVEILNQYQGD